MKQYESPEVTEYGAVSEITEAGTNKTGDGSDEYSNNTPLTGTTFFDGNG